LTSPATDDATRQFLDEHHWFGLPAEDGRIFCQATMWAVDDRFERILLESPGSLFTGPDGHAIFEVSDGSTFEVFPNARVVFRKNTGSTKDLLDVLLGRVRVKIEHMLGIPNPNRVLTPTAVISSSAR